MPFTVYLLTSPSGRRYVGFTSQALQKRLWDHKSDASRKRRKIHHALNKYPFDQWKVNTLLVTDDKQEALKAEIFFIREYDTVNTGYNHSTGGESGTAGITLSVETKALIGLANRGRKKPDGWAEAQRKTMTGRFRTEEQKLKIASSLAQSWLVTHPDGRNEIITNLRKFCRDNNLSVGSLTTWGRTKGYKATKLEKGP